ncbi:hypothetical protein BTJ39_13655 [Izhakiella australiensis]|uniref:DNA utilization protein HofO C-terminal domain-containing protein n=1 Tax=Izhakiella australiensis TaxID=1926881 RepID=A0A1S8YJR7_9GAMM|nr:hypothetical protein [Izhakiella australiensis]OON39324.1 hypothetical protein BTJ39_13655 [Izhakiella australiensis]
MIESGIWWLLTSPPWRRCCILLLMALWLSFGCWLVTGRAAGQQAIQLAQQQRYLRSNAASCLQQLAALPASRLLHARQSQQSKRVVDLARRDFSLSALLRASRAHLLQWQTSPSTRSLQIAVEWPQVSPLMTSLLRQLPGAVISRLRLRLRERTLYMNLVLEVADEPTLAAATAL